MERKRGRSEGVQVRLDPDLKREAKTYLAMTDKTWQELLEQCVQDFVATCRAQYEGQRSLNGKPFRFIQTGGKHHH
jgi:hypothetical protein